MTIRLLLFVILNLANTLFAQNIQGTVTDALNGEVLAYCQIVSLHSKTGTISNEDGAFFIRADENDTLIFSYLGYERKKIPVRSLTQENHIKLIPSTTQLRAINIRANDERLYSLIFETAQNLKKDHTRRTGRVYLSVDTDVEEKAAEFSEAFYNGYFRGGNYDSLLIKNGRAAVSRELDHIVLSFNTSHVLSCMMPGKRSEYVPTSPFSVSLKKLKKDFILSEIYSGDLHTAIVQFEPKNPETAFSGTAWINTSNNTIRKTEFRSPKTEIFPFILTRPDQKILFSDLYVSFEYDEQGRLNFSVLDYHLFVENPDTCQASGRRLANSFPIHTKAMLMAYNYEEPFILPFYRYSPDMDDYRKLSFIPYQEGFWDRNHGILLTGKQKEKVEFFRTNGFIFQTGKKQLVNNRRKLTESTGGISQVFELTNIPWSSDKRLQLLESGTKRDTGAVWQFRSEAYNLDIQILLDVHEPEDSLMPFSQTVYDVFRSWYHLPVEENTNEFINILFDLCEAERRTMEKEMWPGISEEAARTIYEKTMQRMESMKQRYLKETETGRNTKALAHWKSLAQKSLH